jgi:hypothetical protein
LVADVEHIRTSIPAQVGLIDHFVNDGVRLWAVGDDDQTLYAFRASDVRYILEFTKKYLAATVHALDRNYRSCTDIVLALIRHNGIRFDKDYQPALAEPGELVIRGYSSPEVEARQVGRAIADLIGRGCAAQDIAILYRTGAVGVPLQTVLKEMAIPCGALVLAPRPRHHGENIEKQEGHMWARISIAVLSSGAVALALAGWTGGFAAPHPALFADNRPSAVVVDAELVIAVDVSNSMDPEEQTLQREGYITGLTSSEFLNALRSGINGRTP